MKTLKSLTLFTALLVLSSCSTSGNDSKNSGGIGGGGSSDPFLTAISKYSKMTGINGYSGILNITDGGKTLKGVADMDGHTFTFDKSTSATVGKYTLKIIGAPIEKTEATVTINGTTVTIQGLYIGSAPANEAEFKLE